MVFKDPEIILEKTDALCTRTLSTILHYTTIPEHDWIPLTLGLTGEWVKRNMHTCNAQTLENPTPRENSYILLSKIRG